MMPEWLLTSENYRPAGDKDGFINKSIMSMIGLLSRIRAQDAKPRDLFGVQAVFGVLLTLMLVVLLSLTRSFSFVVIILTYDIVLLALMPAKDIIAILKVGIVMTLFTFLILLPAAFYGNTYSYTMIPAKVFATITAVNILSHSIRWNYIISALKRFRIPDLIIFVLDITIIYIVMLGEFSLEMLYALKLRSVGRNREKTSSLSGIAGTMFLKSRIMAEEMYGAMTCRGFTGAYRVHGKFRFGLPDAVYLLVNAGFIYIFIYLQRLT
jgi:cobalt/nickel transport system permease protein